jgi:hypothetical protein
MVHMNTIEESQWVLNASSWWLYRLITHGKVEVDSERPI